MPPQLERWLKAALRSLARALSVGAGHLANGLATAWRLLRPPLMLALNILLALLLLFEEWGWRPLSNLLARLARFRPWALAELWIAGLPPYGALASLAVPSAIIIPAKLLGVFLLATGHIVTATLVIVAAKLAGTALVARIFLLTKPQLMQIAWFKRAYDTFMPWQEALFAMVRASWVWRAGRILKRRAKAYVRRSWRQIEPQLAALRAWLAPRMAAYAQRTRFAARALVRQSTLAVRRLARRIEALGDLKRR